MAKSIEKKVVVICNDSIVEGLRTHAKGDTVIMTPERALSLGSSVTICKDIKVMSTPAGDVITKTFKA